MKDVPKFNKRSKYFDKGRIAAAQGRFIGIGRVAPVCTAI